MIQVARVAPGSGWMAAGGQIWATVRAEIVMQWRRWGFWLAFAFAAALIMLIFAGNIGTLKHPSPHSVYVSLHFTPTDFANLLTFATAHYGDLIFGIVAALLVADRMERDRRLGMLELQRSTDQGNARYVLGKFVGSYLAVLVPAFLGYLLCALFLVILGMPAVFLQTTLL